MFIKRTEEYSRIYILPKASQKNSEVVKTTSLKSETCWALTLPRFIRAPLKNYLISICVLLTLCSNFGSTIFNIPSSNFASI